MHYKIGINCPADPRIIEIIIQAAKAAGADRIGNKVAFVFQGQEAELRAHSSMSKMEEIVLQASVRIEIRCTQEDLYEIYQAIKKVHPQKDPIIEVVRLEDLFTDSHALLTLLWEHYALLKKVIETNAQTPGNEDHVSQWDAHFLAQLPQLEWRLMRYLQQHPDRTCTRGELQQAIWGKDHPSSPDALEQLVRRLRKRIELNPKCPEHLLTVRGLGYRLIGKPSLE
ncbi:MAG TPA: winged helix-turn-helix domain-containing protein [Nitrososphaera sp.]